MQPAMPEFAILRAMEAGKVTFAEFCTQAAGHCRKAHSGEGNNTDLTYGVAMNQLLQDVAKRLASTGRKCRKRLLMHGQAVQE